MNRTAIETVKAFITRNDERYRPAYGRCEVVYRRQCVFAGSTNASTYLRDETGGRRFWPVKVDSIDLDALRRERDQLWAEAVDRFKAGETWWLDDPELIQVAQKEQQERLEEDPWTAPILSYVKGRERVTIVQIFNEVFYIGKDRQGKLDYNRIARILRSLGLEDRRDSKERYWVWRVGN